MPKKKVRNKTTKKQPKSSQKSSFILTIRRKIFYFFPIAALFFGAFILQTSLNKGSVEFYDKISNAETSKSLFYKFDNTAKVGYFEGKQVSIPSVLNHSLAQNNPTAVLGESTGQEKWIEVDLSDQKLIAHDGDLVFLETPVSTGLPGRATPEGEFKIWYKIKATKMSGGEGKDYYYLPNVPYVMFFENENVPGFKGYSLHGTYWHNDFGNRRSHGCVNLPTPIAEKLYYWTNPEMPDGTRIIRSTQDNPGTKIVIHS